MTVSVSTNRAGPFIGNGVATIFPFALQVFEADDVTVVLLQADGTEVTLASGVNYNISINADQTTSPGGEITYPISGAALAANQSLTALRTLAYTQGVSIPNPSAFHASVVEKGLDYITILIQQVLEVLNRVPQAAITDDVDLSLGTAASRANRYLSFDADGNLQFATTLDPNQTLSQSTILSYLTAAGLGEILNPSTTAELATGTVPTLFNIARYKDIPVERHGVVVGAGGDPDDNVDGMNRAATVAAGVSNTGGVLVLPQGTTRVRAGQIGFGADGFGLNAINVIGGGKGQTFIEARGDAVPGQPIFNWAGGDNSHRIDSIFMRDFALSSENGLATGINAEWVIHGLWQNLYFYNLYNGWVGTGCFDNDFLKTNSFNISRSNFLLHEDCNVINFYGCRMCGHNGVLIDEAANCVNLYGGDIEGIVPLGGVAGAGVRVELLAGATFDGLLIDGTHFEHINGYALDVNPTDANGVHGLVWRGGICHGGFAAPESNTFANFAARLRRLTGFAIEAVEFTDWGTAAFDINGTESKGRVEFNPSRGLVAALASQPFATTVREANNFLGAQYEYAATNEYAPLYGPAIDIDRTLGRTQIINVANGVAFTINEPAHPVGDMVFRIRNVSGGGMGAITWPASFKMAAWVNPANTQCRSITVEWNGAAWVETSRTTADVPN